MMGYETVQKLYKATEHPESASLLVTEDCNLACTYCFEKHNKSSMTKATARRALEFLCEGAKRNGSNHFSIMLFGGEPTLEPDIIQEVFEYGLELERRSGLKFYAQMITNATIMNDRLYNLFKKYRDLVNLDVQLSIDGIEKVQDMYRVTKDGKGSFRLVEKNVPIYKEIFEGSLGSLHIHGCVNKKTMPYLAENYMYFRETWGIPKIWFLPICEEEWDDSDVALYKHELSKIHKYIMEHVHKDRDVFEVDNYAPFNRCLDSGWSNVPCGAGRRYVTITASGEVYPCHQIYFNDPDKETLVGNIWAGIDDDKRRLFLEYDSSDMSCPKECTHKHCYRCIAVNWSVNGSILSQVRNKYCDMMKVDEMYQNKIREELISMGLLKNNCEHNCGNHTRDVEPGGKCDVVAYSDACKGKSDECKFHKREIGPGEACDVVTYTDACLGKIDRATQHARKDTIVAKSKAGQVVETWEDKGVTYTKVVNPDGSISIEKSEKESCGGSCSCKEAPVSTTDKEEIIVAALAALLDKVANIEKQMELLKKLNQE